MLITRSGHSIDTNATILLQGELYSNLEIHFKKTPVCNTPKNPVSSAVKKLRPKDTIPCVRLTN
jgi:hypothetical protein